MKQYYKKTPDGTRDLLFEECEARKAVEKALTRLFSARGYNQVVTPSIEFYDVFSRESAGLPQEALYKLTDASGRLIVLRPDNTLPIARIAGGRLKDAAMPLRLYYCQNVFRHHTLMAGHADESTQCGIELIGAQGIRADLEILTMAVESLEACGAQEFRIEIGHAGFFRALCGLLDTNEENKRELSALIEKKNYAALNDLLDTMEASDTVEAIRRLPRLFGGMEILDEAASLCASGEARDALAYLRQVYSAAQKLGLDGNVTIDLGLVHRNNYYTGVVFRGYIEGSGVTVLSGGRYDNLLGEFGEPRDAVGFGVEVDALYKAMLARAAAPGVKRPDVLVFGTDGFEIEALNRVKELTASGFVCENSVAFTAQQAAAYAAARGIARLDIVTQTGVETIQPNV